MRLNRWLVGAALTCCIALSLIHYILADGCSSCGAQAIYIVGFPLSLIGSTAYLVLLIGVTLRPRSIVVFVGAVVFLGMHLAILTSFQVDHPCIYCWAAFLFLVIACLLLIHSRPGITSGIAVVAVSFAVTSVIIHWSNAVELISPSVRRLAGEAANDKSFDSQIINVIVYESKSCGLCDRFNDEYEPRLEVESKRPVKFFHRFANEVTAVPTIIIVGVPDGVYTGLPSYEKLRSVFARL
jgi:hypothetical protein